MRTISSWVFNPLASSHGHRKLKREINDFSTFFLHIRVFIDLDEILLDLLITTTTDKEHVSL